MTPYLLASASQGSLSTVSTWRQSYSLRPTWVRFRLQAFKFLRVVSFFFLSLGIPLRFRLLTNLSSNFSFCCFEFNLVVRGFVLKLHYLSNSAVRYVRKIVPVGLSCRNWFFCYFSLILGRIIRIRWDSNFPIPSSHVSGSSRTKFTLIYAN